MICELEGVNNSTDIEAMYPSLYMSSYYMDDGNWAAKPCTRLQTC